MRTEALALTAVVLIAILVWSARLGVAAGSRPSEDVLFVILAIVPGALVGGRAVHALSFVDVYASAPWALFDLSRGALSLLGAVLGGALTGAYVCRLLGQGVGRWADAAAWPLLFSIGAGKLCLLLGGAGQGMPWDGPWTVAFVGPGPWVSAEPGVAAHPSQVYEGLWTLLGAIVLPLLARRVQTAAPAGRLFGIALCWWLAGRSVVASSWRDEPVIGPFGVEGLLAALALLGALLLLLRTRAARQTQLAAVS